MQKNSLKFPVEIVDGAFGESTVLADLLRGGRALLVADNNVVQHVEGLGTRIGAYVRAHGLELSGAPVVIPGGERIKTDDLKSARRVVAAALAANLGPDDAVVALGGGTLLDVAGWAASQFRGGVRLVRVPTTPAAVMGAAFATTAALNDQSAKDVFVVPSVPAAVVVDLSLSSSVLDGVWRGGLGEAVRLAVDVEPKYLQKSLALAERYRARDAEAFAEIATHIVALRQKKGGTDLGLKTAAALEPKSGWKLPHGYAVAIGVLIDLYVAVKEGARDEADLVACRDILSACGALDGARHSKHILPPELADFW